MKKSNLKAFTLIELLIVIVIIGILAVALIPRLTGSQASARDTARKASVQQIATAAAAFQVENPATLLTGSAQLLASYMGSFPSDPRTGFTTGYVITGSTASGYVICSNSMERPANANWGGCPDINQAIASPSGYTGANGTGYFVLIK